tara:strand:+ start:2765 stop:3154 length:390 start_codon:yes stop_codon:yes gene_type:complete
MYDEDAKSFKLWLSTPIEDPLNQPPFLAVSSIDLGTPEGAGARVITVVYDSEDPTVRGYEACRRMVRLGYNGALAVTVLEEEADDTFVAYSFDACPAVSEEEEEADLQDLIAVLAELTDFTGVGVEEEK